jgi:hypothetical protein
MAPGSSGGAARSRGARARAARASSREDRRDRPRGRRGARRAARALGHEVVHCPLVEVEPLGDEPVDVSGYDWVVVTSVERRARAAPADDRHARRVAAIGRATAERFGGADLVPAVSTQEGLLAELPRPPGACSSPARRVRGGCSSTSSAPTSCRSTGRGADAGELPTATSSCSPRRRPRARSAASGRTFPRSASDR